MLHELDDWLESNEEIAKNECLNGGKLFNKEFWFIVAYRLSFHLPNRRTVDADRGAFIPKAWRNSIRWNFISKIQIRSHRYLNQFSRGVKIIMHKILLDSMTAETD